MPLLFQDSQPLTRPKNMQKNIFKTLHSTWIRAGKHPLGFPERFPNPDDNALGLSRFREIRARQLPGFVRADRTRASLEFRFHKHDSGVNVFPHLYLAEVEIFHRRRDAVRRTNEWNQSIHSRVFPHVSKHHLWTSEATLMGMVTSADRLGSVRCIRCYHLWLQKCFGGWNIYGGYGINPDTGSVIDFSKHQPLLFSAGHSLGGPTDFQACIAWHSPSARKSPIHWATGSATAELGPFIQPQNIPVRGVRRRPFSERNFVQTTGGAKVLRLDQTGPD